MPYVVNQAGKDDLLLQVLHVGRKLPITITLQKIIEKSFPEEYAQRRAEALALEEHNKADGPETPLPLFVMSCMMPGRHRLASTVCTTTCISVAINFI